MPTRRRVAGLAGVLLGTAAVITLLVEGRRESPDLPGGEQAVPEAAPHPSGGPDPVVVESTLDPPGPDLDHLRYPEEAFVGPYALEYEVSEQDQADESGAGKRWRVRARVGIELALAGGRLEARGASYEYVPPSEDLEARGEFQPAHPAALERFRSTAWGVAIRPGRGFEWGAPPPITDQAGGKRAVQPEIPCYVQLVCPVALPEGGVPASGTWSQSIDRRAWFELHLSAISPLLLAGRNPLEVANRALGETRYGASDARAVVLAQELWDPEDVQDEYRWEYRSVALVDVARGTPLGSLFEIRRREWITESVRELESRFAGISWRDEPGVRDAVEKLRPVLETLVAPSRPLRSSGPPRSSQGGAGDGAPSAPQAPEIAPIQDAESAEAALSLLEQGIADAAARKAIVARFREMLDSSNEAVAALAEFARTTSRAEFTMNAIRLLGASSNPLATRSLVAMARDGGMDEQRRSDALYAMFGDPTFLGDSQDGGVLNGTGMKPGRNLAALEGILVDLEAFLGSGTVEGTLSQVLAANRRSYAGADRNPATAGLERLFHEGRGKRTKERALHCIAQSGFPPYPPSQEEIEWVIGVGSSDGDLATRVEALVVAVDMTREARFMTRDARFQDLQSRAEDDLFALLPSIPDARRFAGAVRTLSDREQYRDRILRDTRLRYENMLARNPPARDRGELLDAFHVFGLEIIPFLRSIQAIEPDAAQRERIEQTIATTLERYGR